MQIVILSMVSVFTESFVNLINRFYLKGEKYHENRKPYKKIFKR